MERVDTVNTISISVQGDRKFVEVMRFLAAKRNTTMAELVRTALEEAYGKDIAHIASIFDAYDGAQESERKSSGKKA